MRYALMVLMESKLYVCVQDKVVSVCWESRK